MPETTNCKSCGALVWSTDVPSKKTGNCWRCEVKRLKEENNELQTSVKRLNRRAQAAERAARETAEDCRRKGLSLGRALANYASKSCLEAATELLGYVRHRGQCRGGCECGLDSVVKKLEQWKG